MSSSFPSVSVQVVNVNGRENLDACMSSLEAQVYPRERFEIVLVDAGSSDDCVSFVRQAYPRVRVFESDSRSRGRGAASNAAIRRCDSEFVALLNGDARVDPAWLAELVAAAARHDAVSVASKVLDWRGESVDCVGGTTSIVGQSWAVDIGEPAVRAYPERLLLSSGAGAALYSRAAFLEAGGFDEDLADCLEDVDLGWRLNLLGGRVVLAPRAVTYQRRNESSRWSPRQRTRLVERNALAMIYKNYERVTLERVLPVAVALCLLRGLESSGIDTLQLPFAVVPPDSVDVNPRLIAHLLALEDFARDLPGLERKRAVVQERRRRSDFELFELFNGPFRLYETTAGGLSEEVARALIRDFGIGEMFGARQSGLRSTALEAPTGADQRRQPSFQMPPELPRVSIVILTALGATHLRECLDSLQAQTYPGHRTEIIIVDNGSAEDPTGEIHARFRDANVIRNAANVGFAGGNNQGAAAASGEYVVFLNDDTRVHPDWLHELVETARRRRAAAVSSYILDWSGAAVDFVEGAVNFEAKGLQLKHGMPAHRVTAEEKPLLFACGCAMLIDRAVLVEVGGWDEDAFAYYEDVELGWRLHMLGYQVWLAPRAIVYHKHHGTSGQWPDPPRIRLAERNSLRVLYCLLETGSLGRALPAALLLAADRALLDTGLSRAAELPRPPAYRRLIGSAKSALIVRGITREMTVTEALTRVWSQGLLDLARDVRRLSGVQESPSARSSYRVDPGRRSPTQEPPRELPSAGDDQLQSIPIGAAAVLAGVYGFLADLPKLSQRRAELQRRRRAADRDILERFSTHWLSPCPARLQSEHAAIHSHVTRAFGLNAIGLTDARRP